MRVSNSSLRMERAQAYGCANQNPRRAASELGRPRHREWTGYMQGAGPEVTMRLRFRRSRSRQRHKLAHVRRWPTGKELPYPVDFLWHSNV